MHPKIPETKKQINKNMDKSAPMEISLSFLK
jgi:hypothetical protein